MPTPTYTALANITLGSSATSVSFSSIPATYRDLVLLCAWSGNADTYVRLHLNGSTTGYSIVYAQSNTAGSPNSGTDTVSFIGNISNTTTLRQISITNLFDYAQTDKHKTWTARGQQTAANDIMIAGRWASTSAVTSLVITPFTGSFVSGSTFALYGIRS